MRERVGREGSVVFGGGLLRRDRLIGMRHDGVAPANGDERLSERNCPPYHFGSRNRKGQMSRFCPSGQWRTAVSAG